MKNPDEEQPGLEPVPQPVQIDSGLQVAPLQPYYADGIQQPVEKPLKESFVRRRKKWIGLAVVLLLAIGVGVGVGVRVGLKKNDGDGDIYQGSLSENGTYGTGSQPIGSSARIDDNAALAITTSDRLFFQDRQDRIIQTYFPNGRRGIQPQSIIDMSDAKPKEGSPLAVAEWDDGEFIYLFYIDEDGKIRDHIWRDDKWQPGTLGNKNIKPYGKSQLAAGRVTRRNELHLFYQQGNGKLAELTLDLSDQKNSWKAAPQADTIGSALLGSGLAVVEVLETQFRLYLQEPNRQIIEQCWPAGELNSQKKGDKHDDWQNCRTFPSSNEGTGDQQATDLTPITAARFEGKVNNTHVMYQSIAETIVDQRWDDVEEIWQEVPPNAEKLLLKGKMAARVSKNNTIALIYHAEDGVRSMTLEGDEGWAHQQQPVLYG